MDSKGILWSSSKVTVLVEGTSSEDRLAGCPVTNSRAIADCANELSSCRGDVELERFGVFFFRGFELEELEARDVVFFLLLREVRAEDSEERARALFEARVLPEHRAVRDFMRRHPHFLKVGTDGNTLADGLPLNGINFFVELGDCIKTSDKVEVVTNLKLEWNLRC